MFRCYFCGVNSNSGSSCHKVVTLWRERQYPARPECNRPIKYVDEKGRKKLWYPSDPGGTGYEAIREVSACQECAAQQKPEVVR